MSPRKRYSIIAVVVALLALAAVVITMIVLSQTDSHVGTREEEIKLRLDSRPPDDDVDVDLANWDHNKLPEWAPPEVRGPDTFVIVGLFIRSTDTAKRDAIRSYISKHPAFTGPNPQGVFRFIHGHPSPGKGDIKTLRKEAYEKQDTVILPFEDKYDHLPLKTTLYFRMYSTHPDYAHYDWIVKMDDDSYVNLDFWFLTMRRYTSPSHLEQEDKSKKDKEASKYAYMGVLVYGNVAVRDPAHKHFFTYEEWPEPIPLPPYMLGCVYALNKNLARKVDQISHPMMRIEDAYVGCKIDKGTKEGAIDQEVQYIDMTDTRIGGHPTFMFQVEDLETVKKAYLEDV